MVDLNNRLSPSFEEELLNTQLSSLKIRLENSYVAPYIAQLKKELKSKGINFNPIVWVSDDWFSPDGVGGFALPFYLLHPKLIKLEKKHTGLIEGDRPQELMKLLRHETAHALDNFFGLRRIKRRQKLFGLSSVKYPKFYYPKEHENEFVENLGDNYGQSHPEEDFAETFAVWIDPYSNWKSKYPKNSLAYQKLLLVDDIMLELKMNELGRKPESSPDLCDEISTLDITLGEYYQQKRKRLGKFKIADIQKDLHKIFPSDVQSNKVFFASSLINKEKSRLMNTMISNNNIRPKKINHAEVSYVISNIQSYCEKTKLRTIDDQRSVESLNKLLARHSKNINLDSNRIFM